MGRFSYSLDVGEDLEKEEEANNLEKGDISIKEVAHDEIIPMEKSAPPKESFILTKDDLVKKKAKKAEKKAKKAKTKEKKAITEDKVEEKEDKKEEASETKVSERAQKAKLSDTPKIKLKKYDDSFVEKLRRWQVPLYILIVLIIGLVVMSQAGNLGYAEDKASERFKESEQAQIINAVILEFPYMTAAEKDKIARDRISYRFKEDSFKQELAGFVEKQKNIYKAPSGKVYLFGIEAHKYLAEANSLFEGSEDEASLVSYAIFYFHGIAYFATGSLIQSTFYLPLVLGLISLAVVFFIGKKLAGNLAGFFAAFLFALHPSFFINYSAGWISTGSLTVLLSAVVILLLAYFIDLKKKSFIYLILAIPALILLKISLPEVPKADGIYPSVLIGFKQLSLSGIIDALGGPVISIFAVAGAIYLGYLIYKKHENKYSLLFSLAWFVVLLVASFVSGRYFYYLVPAFCMVIGISVYYSLPYLEKSVKQINLALNTRYLKSLIIIAVMFVLFFTLSNDLSAVNDVSPFMNDGIAFTSNYLQTETPKDSVINTWGELGYIYSAYTGREVIMDFRDFSGLKLYLFSRAMMTDDEYLARDILKVIDCGLGDEFFSEEELRMLSNEELDKALRERADCEAPPGYLVVSAQDYLKIGTMNAFANWNFRKNFMMQDVEGMSSSEAIAVLVENYGLSEEEAEETYLTLDFDEGEGIKFSKIAECAEVGSSIVCQNGFVVNRTDARSGKDHPDKLYIYEGGNKTVVDYNDTRSDLSLVVFVTKKGWRSVVVGPRLSDSVIVRALAGEKFDGMEMVYQVTSPYQINTYKLE